jgi:hypothetical protein
MDFYKQYEGDILTHAKGGSGGNWGYQVARQVCKPFATVTFTHEESIPGAHFF